MPRTHHLAFVAAASKAMADSLAPDMVVAEVATTAAVASADIAAAAWVLDGGVTETGPVGVIATTIVVVVRVADTEAVGNTFPI